MQGFRPGRVPTLAMLVAVSVFCALGTWQIRRLAWRNADLAAKWEKIDAPPAKLAEVLRDPPAHDWRRTTVSGRFEPDSSVFVGPVTLGSVPGVRVLTLLRVGPDEGGAVDGTTRLLIDRGFVPAPEIESFRVADFAGEIEARVGVVRAFTLRAASHGFGEAPAVEIGERVQRPAGAPPERRHRLRFDPENAAHVAAMQEQFGAGLAPVLVRLEAAPSIARPVAGFDRPQSPVDHRGYAVIWFSSAAACFACWLEFGRRRAREREAGA